MQKSNFLCSLQIDTNSNEISADRPTDQASASGCAFKPKSGLTKLLADAQKEKAQP